MRPVRLLAAATFGAAALLPVPSGHAVDRTPTVTCEPWDRQSGVLVWSGHAETPVDAGIPTLLRIICKYRNAIGQFVSVNESHNVPVVATYGGGLLAAAEGGMTTCRSAVAIYDDNSTWTAPETCT